MEIDSAAIAVTGNIARGLRRQAENEIRESITRGGSTERQCTPWIRQEYGVLTFFVVVPAKLDRVLSMLPGDVVDDRIYLVVVMLRDVRIIEGRR